MHWTAGRHQANATDKRHYHEIVEGDGTRVEGDYLPEANLSTSDGVYAAHIRKFGTASIGLSMAAMAGAREGPFSVGKYPVKDKQLAVFVNMVAEYADTYDIEISRETVLSHAEVPITHGIAQPGKWDITWIPGMSKPGDPIEVGDRLRQMVKDAQQGVFASGVSGFAAESKTKEELRATILELFDRLARQDSVTASDRT